MLIKYILFQIILLLFLLAPFFAYSQNCSDLFSSNSKSEIQEVYERLLFDEEVLEQIEKVRQQYDGQSDGIKMGASLRLLSILRNVKDLPFQRVIRDSERIFFENSFFNTLQDLVHISPLVLKTRKILSENTAILQAMLASDTAKTIELVREDNILRLKPKRIKVNSDYISARKKVFEHIDEYRNLKAVPKFIRNERIEELLLADVRYLALPANERAIVAGRVSNELEKEKYDGVELILEKYFTARSK